MNIEDVIIVGAGPAGIACSLQLKRYGINSVLIEKNKIGGLAINANHIENYLGFPNGISGKKFISLLKQQLDRHRCEIHFETVVSIDYTDFLFNIQTDKREFKAVSLVLATGTTPKYLEDISISDDCLPFIHYEIDEISNETNKNIVIIGAGDAAFDYALNLGNKNRITILNRTQILKCLPILNDRAEKNTNISYLPNTRISSIQRINNLLKVNCFLNELKKEIIANYLVIAIGREPNFDILNQSVLDNYYDLINSKRLFPIGDINHKTHRQISISAGEGLKAAMEIFDEIKF